MGNINTLKNEIVDALDGRLDKKFQSFKVELKDEMDKRFEAMDGRFEAMDGRLEALEQTVDKSFRGQGVLMEEIQDDVNVLIEGQEVLHERIDNLQTTASDIESKIEQLDMRLINVEIA